MKSTLTILIFVFACVCSINVSAQKASMTITESQNGKTITIKKQQAFDVLFKKECVGCQYAWRTSLLDSTFIKFVSSTYSHKSCQNCTGGNQDHTFHFKALKASSSQLSFTNGEKEFAVTIKVK